MIMIKSRHSKYFNTDINYVFNPTNKITFLCQIAYVPNNRFAIEVFFVEKSEKKCKILYLQHVFETNQTR